jgi:ABC transport system ATP-binding/permease protein
MKDFLFQPEQARTPIRALSGGEKARLMLARILSKPANLLILDEPTNDLDMETLDLLQELVSGFAGTVILISHDRDFLDRTVTSTIAPNGEGRWIEYAGGYADMLAQRRETAKEAQKAKSPTQSLPRADGPKPSNAKLSYKQKFALENLPGKIEATSAEAAALEHRLHDPAFFNRDPKGFQKATAELEKLRHSIETMEHEWLELEMLKSELEGG